MGQTFAQQPQATQTALSTWAFRRFFFVSIAYLPILQWVQYSEKGSLISVMRSPEDPKA